MAVKQSKQVFQLDHKAAGDWVVVTSEDEDRTVLSVEQAILACRYFPVVEFGLTFSAQFERLKSRLGGWIKAHEGAVAKAFLTAQDGGLLFLMVRTDIPYNRAFETELSKLDIELAQDPDLSLLRLSVLALPKVDDAGVRSFLSDDMVLEYNAN